MQTVAITFPPVFDLGSLSGIHGWWGWLAILIDGAVGLWGLALALARRDPPRPYWWSVTAAIVATLAQTFMGLWLFSVRGLEPGNQHLFYGVVILFTLAFAYIYRAQLRRRPALSYGLLLLFVMGLGLRGIMTFGQSFGS